MNKNKYFNQKVIYYAIINSNTSLGVKNKIEHIKKISNDYCDFSLYTSQGGSFKEYLKLAKKIYNSDAKRIIIRNNIGLLFLLPSLIFQKYRKNTILILELPDTISANLRMILNNEKSTFKKITHLLLILLTHPISNIFFSKILTYSNENHYFRYFSKKKLNIIGNGIDTSQYSTIKNTRKKNENSINFIGVGKLSFWHGFDRLLEGIQKHKTKNNSELSIHFYIIGDGPEIDNLKKTTKRLNLIENITFTGRLIGKDLDHMYEKADIGVSSLGLHRIGLDTGSVLKSREYLSRGLPVIYSYNDIDLNPESEFWLKVDSNEKPIEIEEIHQWWNRIHNIKHMNENIRDFAKNKLDYSVKIKHDYLK